MSTEVQREGDMVTTSVPLTTEQQAIIEGNPEWFRAYMANALGAEWERRIDEMGERLIAGEGTTQEPSGLLSGTERRSPPPDGG